MAMAEIAPHESVIARAAKTASLPAALEKAVIQGDLTYLTVEDRVKFYSAVCNSLGLNPLTKPFLYIQLNGKLTLYASKDATDQLRKLHGVSVTKMETSYEADVYSVRAYGCDKTGRTDVSIGAVTLGNLKGEARANALMKAETKSKRRLTLSLCGLGMLDETEVDSIPMAKRVDGETEVAPGAASVSTSLSEAEQPSPTERPPHIDADGVVTERPPLPDWTRLHERMAKWTPEARAAIPPDEADYLFADPEAEQNREMYINGIKEAAGRRGLSNKAMTDIKEVFMGSRTVRLAHVNIYALRALWIEMRLDEKP